jgi:hypothetical protein
MIVVHWTTGPPLVISVADLVVRHLRHAGVGFVFGVPGGGSNLDIIDAAGRAGSVADRDRDRAACRDRAVRGMRLSRRLPDDARARRRVGRQRRRVRLADRAPLLVFTDGPPASGGLFEISAWTTARCSRR